jgi:hypothetical protein
MQTLHDSLAARLLDLADLYGPSAPSLPQWRDAADALDRLYSAVYSED